MYCAAAKMKIWINQHQSRWQNLGEFHTVKLFHRHQNIVSFCSTFVLSFCSCQHLCSRRESLNFKKNIHVKPPERPWSFLTIAFSHSKTFQISFQLAGGWMSNSTELLETRQLTAGWSETIEVSKSVFWVLYRCGQFGCGCQLGKWKEEHGISHKVWRNLRISLILFLDRG